MDGENTKVGTPERARGVAGVESRGSVRLWNRGVGSGP